MVFKSIIGATCTCLAVVSFNVNAVVLEERLGGLAYYDPDADLTWLADANAAGTTMNWADANAWAAGLTIAGVDGWRLPDTLQPDATCSVQDYSLSYGYNCTGSEMGNLFYNVLVGSAVSSIDTIHNDNYDLFTNVQISAYWSATSVVQISGSAWEFWMSGGMQHYSPHPAPYYGWAVHTGKVPVPAAVWLFGSGLMGLIGIAYRKVRV